MQFQHSFEFIIKIAPLSLASLYAPRLILNTHSYVTPDESKFGQSYLNNYDNVCGQASGKVSVDLLIIKEHFVKF